MQIENNKSDHPIIYYDSYCILCNRFIKFILFVDKKRLVNFAPINGDTFRLQFKEEEIKSLPDSVLYISLKKVYLKSEAIFELLKLLGYPAKFLLVLKILPKTVNDSLYDFIAKKRYHVFGKYDSCPIIPKEIRHRFLP